MARYLARIRLQGPIGTPLMSGTLFGHLCWARRYRDGEEALVEWLASLDANPFVLSDALPAGFLPRPRLAPAAPPERGRREPWDQFLPRLEHSKRRRKLGWVRTEDFLSLRRGLTEEALAEYFAGASASPGRGHSLSVRHAHNTIDRQTGTTPESGGLYFMDEIWTEGEDCAREVYLETSLAKEDLAELLEMVGSLGFGRDASLGRGQFLVKEISAADPRLFVAEGDWRVSLSHGVLGGNMQKPRYRLHTHYGKLGGLYAGGDRSPWKHPLLLTQPGATFLAAATGPYGALLRGVHPHHPEIVHNAWHLCVPFAAA
jgi:CRISPR-associated protein Csm4